MALPYRALAGLLQAADIAITSLDGSCRLQPASPCVETTRNLMAPADGRPGVGVRRLRRRDGSDNHIKDFGLIRGCINNSMFDT